MFLVLAALLFGIFASNVAIGSFDGALFLGDVGEMLLLFMASIAFVVGVLKKEAATSNKSSSQNKNGSN